MRPSGTVNGRLKTFNLEFINLRKVSLSWPEDWLLLVNLLWLYVQHFLKEIANLAFVCLFSHLRVSSQLLQGRSSLLHLFMSLLECLHFDAREDWRLCAILLAPEGMALFKSVQVLLHLLNGAFVGMIVVGSQLACASQSTLELFPCREGFQDRRTALFEFRILAEFQSTFVDTRHRTDHVPQGLYFLYLYMVCVLLANAHLIHLFGHSVPLELNFD